MEILDLRSAPERLNDVIDQNYRQWGPFTGLDRSSMESLFTSDINAPRDQLPFTLIAIVNQKYSGVVSLRTISMGALTHPEEYLPNVGPWLSNMWVAEDCRGRGLATRLAVRLETNALARGISRIYSSTLVADSLYHKLGFTNICTRIHGPQELHIICKDLVPAGIS